MQASKVISDGGSEAIESQGINVLGFNRLVAAIQYYVLWCFCSVYHISVYCLYCRGLHAHEQGKSWGLYA